MPISLRLCLASMVPSSKAMHTTGLQAKAPCWKPRTVAHGAVHPGFSGDVQHLHVLSALTELGPCTRRQQQPRTLERFRLVQGHGVGQGWSGAKALREQHVSCKLCDKRGVRVGGGDCGVGTWRSAAVRKLRMRQPESVMLHMTSRTIA